MNASRKFWRKCISKREDAIYWQFKIHEPTFAHLSGAQWTDADRHRYLHSLFHYVQNQILCKLCWSFTSQIIHFIPQNTKCVFLHGQYLLPSHRKWCTNMGWYAPCCLPHNHQQALMTTQSRRHDSFSTIPRIVCKAVEINTDTKLHVCFHSLNFKWNNNGNKNIETVQVSWFPWQQRSRTETIHGHCIVTFYASDGQEL